MSRSPEQLKQQAEEFFRNLGAAQALDMILGFDPLFEKFIEKECSVDLSKIKDIYVAAATAITDRNKNSLTIENCKKFLEDNQ